MTNALTSDLDIILPKTGSEEISAYLERCNKRGKFFRENRHLYPDQKVLAKILHCSEPKVSRIGSGQESISIVAMDILLALAGVVPSALGTDDERHDECLLRLEDALEAIEEEEYTANSVRTFILREIKLREEIELN
ncbi:MAG: hypothetical protein NXI28_15900 [bacterium]|nr:hypothetical protein [bacterium]